MDKFPLTKDGFVALEAELKHLKGVDRPNIIAAIAEARSHGDLSETPNTPPLRKSRASSKDAFRNLKPSSAALRLSIRPRIPETSSVSVPRSLSSTKTPMPKNRTRLSATMKPTSKRTKFPCLRLWPKRSSAKKSATLPNTSRPAAENLSKFSRSFTNRQPLKFVCQ